MLAVDLDPHAVAQARESAWASGLDALITVRRAGLGMLDPDEVAGRVVLVNAPRVAQDALLSVDGAPVPTGVLVSGLQADDMREVTGAWEARGLQVTRADSVGRWHAVALRAP